MNRRNFLRNGSLASLAIGTVAAASCNEVATEKKEAAKPTPDVFKDDFELNVLGAIKVTTRCAISESNEAIGMCWYPG